MSRAPHGRVARNSLLRMIFMGDAFMSASPRRWARYSAIGAASLPIPGAVARWPSRWLPSTLLVRAIEGNILRYRPLRYPRPPDDSVKAHGECRSTNLAPYAAQR